LVLLVHILALKGQLTADVFVTLLHTKLVFEIRVTRLGEFSPVGRQFTYLLWAFYFLITKAARIIVLLFTTVKVMH
jgi:hypothetical protein